MLASYRQTAQLKILIKRIQLLQEGFSGTVEEIVTWLFWREAKELATLMKLSGQYPWQKQVEELKNKKAHFLHGSLPIFC